MATVIHADLLLGRKVRSREGVSIGRIEEFDAKPSGEELVVTAILVGPPALVDRLSPSTLAKALLRALGLAKRPRPYRIGWDEIDLTDPDHPRILCDERDLRRDG